MGYTNYWSPKKPTPKPSILSEEFRAYLRKIVTVAYDNNIKCHVEEGDGFVAVIDDTQHSESFCLDTRPKVQNNRRKFYYGFNLFAFCKTYATPFDAVVKCCIVAGIKHDIFVPTLCFDGNKSDEEYIKALDLAKKIDPEFAKFFESIPVED